MLYEISICIDLLFSVAFVIHSWDVLHLCCFFVKVERGWGMSLAMWEFHTCYSWTLDSLYADDTIVFADSAKGLQKALNSLNQYCEEWKLTVNEKKKSYDF